MFPEIAFMIHQSLEQNVQSVAAGAPTQSPMIVDVQDFQFDFTPAPFAFPDIPQGEVNAAVGIATGLLVAILLIALVYLILAIWMFVHLMTQDAKLPPNQRVFTGCCMFGYILVFFFTPICCLPIYFCVTLGQINDRRQQVVNYNQNPNQQMQVAPYNPNQPVIPQAQAAPVVDANQVKMLGAADEVEKQI